MQWVWANIVVKKKWEITNYAKNDDNDQYLLVIQSMRNEFFFIISNIVESKYKLLFIHPSFLLDLLIIIDHDWKMYFSFLSILFIIPIGMNFCFDNTIEWDVRNKIRHVELISRKRFHQHNTFVIKTKTKKKKNYSFYLFFGFKGNGKRPNFKFEQWEFKIRIKKFYQNFFFKSWTIYSYFPDIVASSSVLVWKWF